MIKKNSGKFCENQSSEHVRIARSIRNTVAFEDARIPPRITDQCRNEECVVTPQILGCIVIITSYGNGMARMNKEEFWKAISEPVRKCQTCSHFMMDKFCDKAAAQTCAYSPMRDINKEPEDHWEWNDKD